MYLEAPGIWGLQANTRVKPFICTMPMRLDEGWNQIQFNLADFTRRAYGGFLSLLAQHSYRATQSLCCGRHPVVDSTGKVVLQVQTTSRHFGCKYMQIAG